VVRIITKISKVLVTHTPFKKSSTFVNNFLIYPANIQRERETHKQTEKKNAG